MTASAPRLAILLVSGLLGSLLIAACVTNAPSTPLATTPQLSPSPGTDVVSTAGLATVDTPTAESIIPTASPTFSTSPQPTSPTSTSIATPQPTATPERADVASPSATPIVAHSPAENVDAASSPMRERSNTPAPSATPTKTPVPHPTAPSTSDPTATPTNVPTSTATPTPTPTLKPTFTPAPSATKTPSPTPNPLESIEFVDNEDCQGNISYDLLATENLTLSLGDASFDVIAEVADDGGERQQGLMCRKTVPVGTGMLFVFQRASPHRFWMFNTYVPLDIVYVNESRRVVKALRMEPCPRPAEYEDNAWRSHCSGAASGYGSGADALYALELPAGWLESIGLALDNLENLEVSW